MTWKVLLIVTVGMPMAADVKEDGARQDLAKLQGRWEMVSSERDGIPMPADDVKTYSRTISGNKYTVVVKGETGVTELHGTIALDPTKNPKTIDAVRTEGATKGQPMLGIYELDGDKQKVCFAPVGMEQPTKFSSKDGAGHVLTVWKRIDARPAKQEKDPN
jgi:uncharacterized protein (TIGR03067 family)